MKWMSNEKSIAKNLSYNIVYQVMNLVLPLITVPYVSRILGSYGVGVYSYTYSIAAYFVLFGTLGLTMYGNRQIAYTRDDKHKMSEAFWNLFNLRFLLSAISLIVYLIIFSITDSQYKYYLYLQSIFIISGMIDISWLYMGLEDFKKTVTRSIVFKVLGVILIFLLVKNGNDINKYIIILAGSTLVGNLTLWTFLPKTVSFCRPSWKEMKSHFLPAVSLFIPQIAISLYVLFDKTMLGLLGSDINDLGYYERSEQIVKISVSLLTAISTVMFPRMSYYHSNNDQKKLREYLNINLQGASIVAIAITFGLAGIAKEFVPWFLGREFEHSILLMIILSPISLLLTTGSVTGTQYLMPTNRIKKYTTSVLLGCAVNLILNFILIPMFDAVGACIATLFAELTVSSVQLYYCRNIIDIAVYAKKLLRCVIVAVMMYALVRYIGDIMGASIITTAIQIVVGAAFYTLILMLFKEPLLLKGLERIKSTVFKKARIHVKGE